MRRRSFLQRLAWGVAATTTTALPYGLARLMSPDAYAASHTHLRPPGALKNEEDFLKACIGCGLCGEVCPVGAIRFYDRSGGNKINTPYINPEITACTLTGHCMKVCPTEAMSVVPIREVTMGYAQIDRTACYPWVDRGVCGVCATACPLGEEAIGFAFANIYRPVVKKGCVGCGVCVQVCPHPSLPIKIVARSLGEEKAFPTRPIPTRRRVDQEISQKNGSLETTIPFEKETSNPPLPQGLMPF